MFPLVILKTFAPKFGFITEYFSVTFLLLYLVGLGFFLLLVVTHSRELPCSLAAVAGVLVLVWKGIAWTWLRATGLNQPCVARQGLALPCAFQLSWFTAGSPVPRLYWNMEQHLAAEMEKCMFWEANFYLKLHGRIRWQPTEENLRETYWHARIFLHF